MHKKGKKGVGQNKSFGRYHFGGAEGSGMGSDESQTAPVDQSLLRVALTALSGPDHSSCQFEFN